MAKKKKSETSRLLSSELENLGLTTEEIEIILEADIDPLDCDITKADEIEMGVYILSLIASDHDFAISINRAIDDVIAQGSISEPKKSSLIENLEHALKQLIHKRH